MELFSLKRTVKMTVSGLYFRFHILEYIYYSMLDLHFIKIHLSLSNSQINGKIF